MIRITLIAGMVATLMVWLPVESAYAGDKDRYANTKAPHANHGRMHAESQVDGQNRRKRHRKEWHPPVNCGDELSRPGNYRLESNQDNCTSSIKITSSNVHLDLAGHTITCNPDAWEDSDYPYADAISVNYNGYLDYRRNGTDLSEVAVLSDVHVRNGTISNCLDGMFVFKTDRSKVAHMNFLSNNRNDEAMNSLARGISLESSHNNQISNSLFNGNFQGIALNLSNSNKLSENIVTQSEADGIILFGSSGNTLKHNESSENVWGIWLQYDDSGEQQSTGNTIVDNEVLRNAESGIFLIGGSDDNVIRKNTVVNNATGIGLLGVPEFGIPVPSGNSVFKNVVTGNALSDLLEFVILDYFGAYETSPAEECGNLWKSNTFDTSLGPVMCIE